MLFFISGSLGLLFVIRLQERCLDRAFGVLNYKFINQLIHGQLVNPFGFLLLSLVLVVP